MIETVVCKRCDYVLVAGERFCGGCGADVQPIWREVESETAHERALLESLRRTTLGEYEIREELGRGGMATVFLAHDLRLNKKVALKVLSPHLQMMPGMAARFLREAQTAAGLEHPNIIPIYAYRETADIAFFSMRYVDGASLAAVAKQVGKFPVATVRALLSDIGGALAFSHAHGVLHRDVKPGNILLGRDGSVVVTDFGIAKQAEGQALTLTGQLLGTPAYMSPEQCRGGELSMAADQYSLGAMAFEMLAGRSPFTGKSAGELIAQHLMEPAPHVSKFRPDCPPDLAEAVMRMLAKDPLARFASIEDALAAAHAMPVLPSDSVRSELKQWAQSPALARKLANTPVSPMVGLPRAQVQSTPVPATTPAPLASAAETTGSAAAESTPTPREPAARRSRGLMMAIGAVAMVGTVMVIIRGRTGVTEVVPPPLSITGTLHVDQLPAAGRAFVDGALVDGEHVALSAGSHKVRLEAPGFASIDTVVQVMVNDTATLVFAAIPDPPPPPPPPTKGTLVVTGLPPDGSVLVDGRRVAGARVDIEPGRHVVRLQAPGYDAVEKVVRIIAGEPRTVAFDGKPTGPVPPPPPPPTDSGLLMVRVKPFAKVFVDGQLTVEDEKDVRKLPYGRHTLRFEKAGYVTLDTAVSLRADTLKMLFTLQPRTP